VGPAYSIRPSSLGHTTCSNLALDKLRYVTVELRIMRDRLVTYSADVVFSALADPTRRAVLDLLRVAGLPAGQIAQAFPVTRPAISKHLRYLRRAHLVTETRVSRQRVYALNVAPLQSVDAWLSQYRGFWATSLTSLKTVVESQSARRASGPRKKKT
jgi:DNA-binding transcriptional ArsR family regulator